MSRLRSLPLLLALAASASAQNFTIARIIDANTARPDGKGNFTNPHGVSTDGRYVVFNELGGDLSVWSADLTTMALTRLANTSNAVPGGTGNFTGFGQIGGGPYANFNAIVRNGTAVFSATDSAGQGLYSIPAAGGAIQRVVNYNTALPNGARLGPAGNAVSAFGLNDTGNVVFAGTATGTQNASVYTAGIDGSSLALVDDENHRFLNAAQTPGNSNSCVQNFGTPAIGGATVVWSGSGGGTQWAIYSLPVGAPAQGVTPDACGTGPAGPLVVDSRTLLPGDPNPGRQFPDYDFLQTDGQAVYFHGSDFTIGCCSSLNGGFGGIFSVPLSGGAITRIVANGDTLPAIGKVTNVQTSFSVDAGGVVFIALNESVTPTVRGIFLYRGGTISKVFASGDALDGGTLTQNGSLEVWPQCYKNGKIAFEWAGGVFVAGLSGPPAITSMVSASGFGAFTAVAPGSWIEVSGSNLATNTRTWAAADFTGTAAPTMLDKTSVTIGGQAAFISYISSTQVNAQVPNVPSGPQSVVVTSSTGTSPPATILVNPLEPGLLAPPSFAIGGKQYAVALFPDLITYVLPPGTIAGVPSRRAVPGDTIILFGIGFGPAIPDTPPGQVTTQSNHLAATVQFSIGGAPAAVSYSGLVQSVVGLYQFNVVVPNIAASDAAPLTFTLGGADGTQTLYLTVAN